MSDAFIMADDSIPIKTLSRKQMQELFHKHQLWERIQKKEFRLVPLRERHANPLKSGQVFCTYSQIVSFRNLADDEIIRAHQYKLPDGTLGASKKPDPLRVFIDGIIHKLEGKS
jgi:hypothetical protein